jgi:hypothetical protein
VLRNVNTQAHLESLWENFRIFLRSVPAGMPNVGGLPMWLGWELRARLKDSLEAAEARQEQAMTKPFGGIDYTFSIEQWRAMINAVESYAGDCQAVTEGHRRAVDALSTISEVES